MASDTTMVRADIRAFIASRHPNAQFGDADDIFGLGFVNSLFAMQLVMFIERQFGIRIPNEALRLDRLRSIAAMSDLVDEQRRAAG